MRSAYVTVCSGLVTCRNLSEISIGLANVPHDKSMCTRNKLIDSKPYCPSRCHGLRPLGGSESDGVLALGCFRMHMAFLQSATSYGVGNSESSCRRSSNKDGD